MELAHIFLIGAMGSGKSTIGPQLAELLGVPFLDLDVEIEARTYMSVEEIFETRGEFEFRACEAQMLRELPSRHPASVIATGGGAPLYFDSMDYLLATGRVVFLDASAAELTRRLEPLRDGRPLLAREDWQAFIADQLAERRKTYQRAQITLVVDDHTPQQTLDELARALGVRSAQAAI